MHEYEGEINWFNTSRRRIIFVSGMSVSVPAPLFKNMVKWYTVGDRVRVAYVKDKYRKAIAVSFVARYSQRWGMVA